MANAFRILRAKSKTGRAMCYEFIPISYTGISGLIDLDFADKNCRKATVHSAWGSVEYNFGHPIIGCIMNGSGYPLAVVTRDRETGTEWVQSVGVCGECCRDEVVPYTTSADFDQPATVAG